MEAAVAAAEGRAAAARGWEGVTARVAAVRAAAAAAKAATAQGRAAAARGLAGVTARVAAVMAVGRAAKVQASMVVGAGVLRRPGAVGTRVVVRVMAMV